MILRIYDGRVCNVRGENRTGAARPSGRARREQHDAIVWSCAVGEKRVRVSALRITTLESFVREKACSSRNTV